MRRARASRLHDARSPHHIHRYQPVTNEWEETTWLLCACGATQPAPTKQEETSR